MVLEPAKGTRISAEWGSSVARAINALAPMHAEGTLARSGGLWNGAANLPQNRRERRTTKSHPFLAAFVLRTGTEQDPDSETTSLRSYIEMYCAADAVTYQGEAIAPGIVTGGFEPGDECDLNESGWQRIHETEYAQSAPTISKTVYLEIDATDPEAVIWNVTDESAEEDDAALLTYAIGEVTGGAVTQSRVGAQNFGANTDGASIDAHGGEDGGCLLQLAHFNDTENDSGKGLVTRLKVNLKTGEITVDGDDALMVVCRKNGQLIYVPLAGDGEDPDSEEGDSGVNDPCDHPGGGDGSNGGVASDADNGGGVGGGGAAGSGGVAADGDAHPGKPCTGETC